MTDPSSRRSLSGQDPHLVAVLWDNWFAAAADGNSALLAMYLRDYDLPIDQLGPQGTTALMEAAFAGHGATVDLLLEHGARPDLEGTGGGDALSMAAAGGQRAVVRQLVAAGARVDAIDSRRGGTALVQAASRGHKAIALDLLELGADPWMAKPGSPSAIEMAVVNGHNALVDRILARDRGGWPGDWLDRLLWAAAAGGRVDLCQRFLADGANPHAMQRGRTPLQQAEARGHAEAAAVLRAAVGRAR